MRLGQAGPCLHPGGQSGWAWGVPGSRLEAGSVIPSLCLTSHRGLRVKGERRGRREGGGEGREE